MSASAESELKALKHLVRRFLREIKHVPFRSLDCDQKLVNELEIQLLEATSVKRQRKQST